MLEGYKPIDFGSNNFPIRNRAGLSQAALNILATSRWKEAPIASLLSQGLDVNGEAPKREQSLWGRITDLLSTPAYAIANAADDALAGHQSSDTDSVLNDAKEISGGIVMGALRGAGTGLRGFAGDLVGMDPTDPQDKQYLGDFLVRLDTHMSAEDAMKPENREEVRQRLLGKKINQFISDDDPTNKYFYKFDTGEVSVSDQDIEDYFKRMNIYGLGASMVADPLNFVTGWSKPAQFGKSAEIPGELVTDTKNIYDGFKAATEGAPVNTGGVVNPTLGTAPGSYKVNFPESGFKIPTTEGLVNPPAWFNFPKNASDMGPVTRSTVETPVAINSTDPLDEMINSWAPGHATQESRQFKGSEVALPRPAIPDEQISIAESLSSQPAILKLTGDLLRRAATGNMDLSSRLATKYPGVNFPQTNEFIKFLKTVPDLTKRLGIPGERQKIVSAFTRTITADVAAMKVAPKAKSAELILNETAGNPVAMGALVENAKGAPVVSKNPTRDASIVDDVVKQFEPQLSLNIIPSGINNPAKYKEAMRKHGVLTGPKQVNVWNALTSKYLVNVKTPSRFAKALSLLRQAEERFMGMGHIPMSSTPKLGNSIPLRLSQVLEAIGPASAAMNPTLLTKILRGEENALKGLSPEVIQKIEELKAGEAIVDGSKSIAGIDAVKPNLDELIKGPLSAARTEEIVTIGSKVADDITRSIGGSPVAGKNAAVALKTEYIPKAPGDGFPVTNTTALISHPNVSSNLLKKYSNAPTVARQIHSVIGGPTPRRLGELYGPAAKTVEWLGARFNAAYKNADMRPIYLKNAAFAKSTVARRAEYLNKLAKQYDVNDADLWNDALKGAQGRIEAVSGTPSAALSDEIRSVMENLFGSSALKNSLAIENSVAGRAQLFMQELNRNLRRFGLGEYQFKKTGDYANGTDWLKSWESWDIKKPLEFLFKMQNVVEHTVREKIMFDEIAARFGTLNRGGEFTHKVNHPRLSAYYFGKESAEQINQFIKNLKDVSTPSSKSLQMLDKAISKWKAGVTIYVPSHHVRNMIGDLYFNWLSGVNSLRPYNTALRIMQSQRNRYEGLEGINQLIDPNAIKAAMSGATSTPAGKQTALTMRNGQNVTNDMVYLAAFHEGILPTTRVLEDIPDDAMTGLDRIKPLGGRGQKVAHTISEGRDHYVRLAHFVDALKKSPKSFDEAIKDAAAIVRKWHPDGMDLTKFERNVMRRVFPFYSWTRKAFPLIVESLVATPGKVMAIPKANYLLQNMLGIETGPMSDPFPTDQLFPDWIREKGIGPVAGPDSILTSILGGQPGYSVINPGNPTLDTIAQLNNPGKMAVGMSNPALRIPFEISSGRESQTGAPIDSDYYIKQIPGLSHAGRATGEFGVSDTQKENSQGYNMQNILNMLTAMGFQNTGPYRKSSEFDLREFLKSQRE
ncbi:hypothetical protein ACFY7C_36660 [Streptomyces sp. NPDC012769]|uniref:hypothetical protein n=1 Tax=Streptomyces sp. NPDC012769 TaxID=3364848 RepID=UPI0036A27DCF